VGTPQMFRYLSAGQGGAAAGERDLSSSRFRPKHRFCRRSECRGMPVVGRSLGILASPMMKLDQRVGDKVLSQTDGTFLRSAFLAGR